MENKVTPEIEAKWRTEFEQLLINVCVLADLKQKSNGEYFNHHTQNKWEGFLLGRSTVEIDVGVVLIYQDAKFYMNMDRIAEQGYRVKGEM